MQNLFKKGIYVINSQHKNVDMIHDIRVFNPIVPLSMECAAIQQSGPPVTF